MRWEVLREHAANRDQVSLVEYGQSLKIEHNPPRPATDAES